MMILSMTMLLTVSLVQGTKSPAEPQGLAVPSPEALGRQRETGPVDENHGRPNLRNELVEHLSTSPDDGQWSDNTVEEDARTYTGDDKINYIESRGDLENPRDTHTVPVHVIIPLSLQNFYTRQNQS